MTAPALSYRVCAYLDCDRPAHARGLCDGHYKHRRRYSMPLPDTDRPASAPRPPRPDPLPRLADSGDTRWMLHGLCWQHDDPERCGSPHPPPTGLATPPRSQRAAPAPSR